MHDLVDSNSLIENFNDLSISIGSQINYNLLILGKKDEDIMNQLDEQKVKEIICLDQVNLSKQKISFQGKIEILIKIISNSYSKKILFLEKYGILISTEEDITKFSCAICNSQKANGGVYEVSPHPTNILDKNNKVICTCPSLLKKTIHYSGRNIIGCDICKNTLKPQHTKIYCPKNDHKKKMIICWKIIVPINLIDKAFNNYLENLEIENLLDSLNEQ